MWGDLRAASSELAAAVQSGDKALFRQAVERQGAIIQAGGEVEGVWDKLPAAR